MTIATNPEEYSKLLGRDRAYVEIEASNLIELAGSKPKFVVIKANRLEVSDPACVDALVGILERMRGSAEAQGLSDEQLGFYIFKKVFEAGLKALSKE